MLVLVLIEISFKKIGIKKEVYFILYPLFDPYEISDEIECLEGI